MPDVDPASVDPCPYPYRIRRIDPSPDAADRLLDHLRVRLAAERLLELRHVGDDAVDAVASGRVRVGLRLQPRDLRSLGSRTTSVAQPRKKRCSGVKPSTSAAVLRLRDLPVSAISASRRPPLSAVFSPSVSLPLSFTSADGGVAGVLDRRRRCARSSNALPSAGVHQSRRLPSASNWRPWSSKPCVSSWPIDRAGARRSSRRRRRPAIEERRLQDAGREVDVVLERVVVRVDRRRRHAPLGLSTGLPILASCRAGTRTRWRAASCRARRRARSRSAE